MQLATIYRRPTQRQKPTFQLCWRWPQRQKL